VGLCRGLEADGCSLLTYSSRKNILGRSLPPAQCLHATEGRLIYFALGDVNFSEVLLLAANYWAEKASDRPPRQPVRAEPSISHGLTSTKCAVISYLFEVGDVTPMNERN
jgi:hypothetical protein